MSRYGFEGSARGRVLFHPQPLPPVLAEVLQARVRVAHAEEPFSPVDARRTVSRVVDLVAGLPLEARVYRGGVDLLGVEVDHLWVAVGHDGGQARVLDVAFPLFDAHFVEVLRRFVAGDARAEELFEASRSLGVEARVIGEFPPRMRYLGKPLWRST